MKTVGEFPRDEIVLDPREALRRGRVLDAMLKSALPAYPRGVMRGTHETFQRMDEARMIAIARRVAES